MPSCKEIRKEQQKQRRLRSKVLRAGQKKRIIQQALDRKRGAKKPSGVSAAAINRAAVERRRCLPIHPIRSVTCDNSIMGACLGVFTALQLIVARYVQQAGLFLAGFVDSCDVGTRSSRVPRVFKHARSRPGFLGCNVFAVHVLTSSTRTQRGQDWYALARWFAPENYHAVKNVVQQQLLLHRIHEALPPAIPWYWVCDFKMLLLLLGHVPPSHASACPFCRLTKQQWRQPCLSPRSLQEEFLRTPADFPLSIVSIPNMSVFIYCAMHMLVQVYVQLLSALYLACENWNCASEFIAYLSKVGAPFEKPMTPAPGQNEFTPLWRAVVKFVKSKAFWMGIAEALPVKVTVTARKSEGTVTYSLAQMMETTFVMVDAQYTDDIRATKEQYICCGQKWTEMWYLIGLQSERLTTPLHIFSTHACEWCALPTAALCGQGGEHSHQGIKTLGAEHYGLRSTHMPVMFRLDMERTADQILSAV